MCTVKNLTTERRIITPMEHRRVKRFMSYKQIQFNSDCVCRYAGRKGINIGEAFNLLEQHEGISFLEKLFTAVPRPTIGVAVGRLDRFMKSRE